MSSFEFLIGAATVVLSLLVVGFYAGYYAGKSVGYWKGVNDGRDASR